jgi:glucose/arabinose dehydrogenase
MRLNRVLCRLAALLLLTAAPAVAADPKEDDYYTIFTFPVPEGVVLEVGALEMLPGARLAVSTRRGEIYLVDNPFTTDPKAVKFTRFAHGLHEVLGLAYRDGWLYVTQRGELSRIKDRDGDGVADVFETVSDLWEINGDYHEYAFGSKFDRDGNLWVALCLTGSFTSENKFRGMALRVTPDGRTVPTTSGLRSPGGLGMNADGDMFFTENQGPWNGACALKHLKPGAFVGHPASFRWYDEAPALGPRPKEPQSNSRLMAEAKKIPELLPPAVYFPYPKMGQSASGIVCDTTAGKFGPFPTQMFVGDQSASTVMRVALEKVQGRYQGVCFPFREGFASGNLAMLMTPDGSLFVGGTSRGWGARGSKPFALQRLNWTGKVPFEVLAMHAVPNGFDLEFTEPVDTKTAGDPQSYRLRTHTYIYQASYGSPEVDETFPKIEKAEVSADGRTVRLTLETLEEGHIHELHLDGVRSARGLPLLHKEAYYTLNYLPPGEGSRDPGASRHGK